MYSSRLMKLLYYHTSSCQIWGGCSIKFDQKKCEFYTTPHGKYFSMLCIIMLLIYSGIFLPIKIYTHNTPEDFEDFNFAVVVCMASSMGVVVSLFNFFKAEELSQLINESLRFCKRFQKEYMKKDYDPNRSRKNIILDVMVAIQLFCGNSLGIIIATHSFLYPKTICYFSSEVQDIYLESYLVLLNSLVFVTFAQAVCTLLGLLCSMGTAYYFLIVPIYAEELIFSIHRQNQNKYGSIPCLRGNVKHLTFVYRQVDILHNIIVSLGGVLIIPLQTTALGMVLFCNSMMITNGSNVSAIVSTVLLVISIMGSLAWSFFLKMTGNIFTFSVKTLGSWRKATFLIRSKKDVKYLRKFHRSCKPLQVGYGKYYTIKPLSVLNFLKGIARGTMRITLAAKKKPGT